MPTKNPRLEKLIQAFCDAPGAERNLYDSLKKLLTDAASPSRCDAASVVIDSPIPGTRCAPDLTLYLLGAYFGERDRRFRDRDRFEVGAGLRGEDCRDEVELSG